MGKIEDKQLLQARNQLLTNMNLNERVAHKDAQQKKSQLPADDGGDKTEDALIAFDLLNKFKKDRAFISKELQAQSKKSKLIV